MEDIMTEQKQVKKVTRKQMQVIEYEDGTIEIFKPERKKREKKPENSPVIPKRESERVLLFRLLGEELRDDLEKKEYNKLIQKAKYKAMKEYIHSYLPLLEKYNELKKENERLTEELDR